MSGGRNNDNTMDVAIADSEGKIAHICSYMMVNRHTQCQRYIRCTHSGGRDDLIGWANIVAMEKWGENRGDQHNIYSSVLVTLSAITISVCLRAEARRRAVLPEFYVECEQCVVVAWW